MTTPEGIRLVEVVRHFATPTGLVRAVDGISVEVDAGTSLAITGSSGSGKSTLLALIGGLVVPTSGQVFVAGREISNLGDEERTRFRRHQIGFVFQTDNLLPFLTALENVSQQLAFCGVHDDDRCLELLDRLGVGDHAHKLPDQLSGGQRQRVAVARALVHQPSVVVADEPTGSLDAENSATLIDLLLASRRDAQATLVVVTHDAAIARRMDRTVSIGDGRIRDEVDGVVAEPTRDVGDG